MQRSFDDVPIRRSASQASGRIVSELTVVETHQIVAVLWQQSAAVVVVASALLASSDTRDRRLVIEDADPLGVLALVILDHEIERRVEGIDWKSGAATAGARVADEEGEAVLPQCYLAEDVVTKVDHVGLVTRGHPDSSQRRSDSDRSNRRSSSFAEKGDNPRHVAVFGATDDDLPETVVRMPVQSRVPQGRPEPLGIDASLPRHLNSGGLGWTGHL